MGCGAAGAVLGGMGEHHLPPQEQPFDFHGCQRLEDPRVPQPGLLAKGRELSQGFSIPPWPLLTSLPGKMLQPSATAASPLPLSPWLVPAGLAHSSTAWTRQFKHIMTLSGTNRLQTL